jgi:hypothetical protein
VKKILPIILVVFGVVGGGAAGMFLKPAPEPTPDAEGQETPASANEGHAQAEAPAAKGVDEADASATQETPSVDGRAYVKIGKQTIVPVVEGGETRALMLFELAIDVPLERRDAVHELEPRLRDGFLRELMKMSHTGAFMATFTDDRIIEELRRNLVHSARQILGDDAQDVLILDVMRQEL